MRLVCQHEDAMRVVKARASCKYGWNRLPCCGSSSSETLAGVMLKISHMK